MTLLEILNRLALSGSELVLLLEALKLKAPDLAPQIDEWLAKLNDSIGTEALVSLATVLPSEIANIAQGQLDPHDHPSDSI
jgi:hypothetical protein